MKNNTSQDFKFKTYESKNKVFYSAILDAWINTKLEKDKCLLNISVLGIGLLVVLLRFSEITNTTEGFFFDIALLSFLNTVISVILILSENAKHLERVLAGQEKQSRFLEFLDNFAQFSFIIGAITTVAIAISSSLE